MESKAKRLEQKDTPSQTSQEVADLSNRSGIISGLKSEMLKALIGLYSFALGQQAKSYGKMSSLCFSGCFIESWTAINGGKPVDSKSPLFNEIFDAMDWYFYQSSYARGADFNVFEQELLKSRYLKWVVRDLKRPDPKQSYRFVLKHRLAKIFRRYVNLHNFVGYVAAKEIASLETKASLPHSAAYWKSVVEFETLPVPFSERSSSRSLKAFLEKRGRELKRDLARGNHVKLEISLGDISAFIALSGSLLLVLGYLRTYLFAAYFEFPFQEYYGTSDYLTTSLNLTGGYLFSALLAACFSFSQLSSMNAYSVHQSEAFQSSIAGKINSWGLHLLGLSSFAALLALYYREKIVEPFSLFVTLVYLSSLVVPRIVLSFFSNPLKSYILVWLVLTTFIGVVTGVVREINALETSSQKSEYRILKFDDASFSEIDWKFLSFTAEYVIMKNRQSKLNLVRGRSGLKSIENVRFARGAS
jgi:hypothetical protein